MEKFVIALDQGTTSSRAIIFNKKGGTIAIDQKEHQQEYPQSGWVEHNPKEILTNQILVAENALKKAKIKKDQIACIGISNQRETTVVWDRKTGEAIYPAIVWQDRRTADLCNKYKDQGLESTITEKTGLRLDPYFSATKIRWILENVEGAQDKANSGHLAFGTIDSWLLWNLTNGEVHATDVTNASRTMLMNIRTCQWDEELLNAFEIAQSLLPEIKSNSELYGEIQCSENLDGIPITGIAGDQQSALFGQACFEKGTAKNTYGTGCFLLLNTGNELVYSKNQLLSTVAWKIGDDVNYALEGSVFIGGASIQWLRDELEIIDSASEITELARSVPDSGGVILVPAFAGLGAPHWDPKARGTIFGITRGTNKAHIARATLESIALQVMELVNSMENDANFKLSELRVDGGVTNSDLLMQFQSNLLNVDIVRSSHSESTALGAAYFAGLTVGFWDNQSEILTNWSESSRFTPSENKEKLSEKIRLWNRAVDRSKNWIP